MGCGLAVLSITYAVRQVHAFHRIYKFSQVGLFVRGLQFILPMVQVNAIGIESHFARVADAGDLYLVCRCFAAGNRYAR